MRCLTSFLAVLLCATPALAAPKVIASVVPVHGIVDAVMGDVGRPELLLKGRMSEHRASFTANQVAELGKADLVFIVGHGLEAKLAQLSGTEAVNGKTFIELAQAPGIATLAVRRGGGFEPHDHDAEEAEAEDAHAEGILSFDPHVWLDPENAKAMAVQVTAELSTADPGNAATYMANAIAFGTSVDETAAAIAAQLAPVKHRPYVVFHDAYQYFEKHFGLGPVGAIADVSAHAPSAQRLKDIRGKITATKAVCVFREPQYDDKVVNTVIEDTGARAGVLDPLGADVTPGPGAYQQLLRNLGQGLVDCLKG